MTTVPCPTFRDAWVERGATAPPEAIAHAASCAACREALHAHEATWVALGRSPAPPRVSDGFRDRVFARLEAERARRRRFGFAALAVAAAAAILVAVALRRGDETPGPSPAAPPAELLANLDFYENLEFLEESGEELDWIAAMTTELEESDADSGGE